MNKPVFHEWSNSDTEYVVIKLLKKIVINYGFSGAVFAYSPIGWMPSHGPGAIKKLITYGVDEQLLQDWQNNDVSKITDMPALSLKFDPIRKVMTKNTLPKRTNLKNILKTKGSQYTALEVRWCQALYNFGIINVVTIPVQMPPSEYWSLSLLQQEENSQEKQLSSQQKSELMFFTHNLVRFCVEILKWREEVSMGSNLYLRPRERDCLKWAAHGKSASATADILGLKVETVRKYLKNALSRLDCRNKTQAVVKSLRLGLIDLVID